MADGDETLTDLAVGLSASITVTVADADTAIAQGSGDVPVLATPRVVALVEGAACQAIVGCIAADRTTVGTLISMRHLAPSLVGSEVTATATVSEVDGKMLSFDVTATMGDQTVADGSHTRVIVRREAFGG
jgi:fluoroacetyl-CoA thioesterase